MKNIYVVEDHVLLSEGLKNLLENNFPSSKVKTFDKGLDVLLALEKHTPDVIILDLNIPGLNGIDVLSRIQGLELDVRVIIYTMYNDSKLVENCKDKGASAYILKNTSYEELLELLKQTSQDEFYYGENVKTSQDKDLFKDGFRISVSLTSREKEIITLLAEDMTSAEIAERLCISPYTVDTHRKNLIKKLKVKSVAGVVKFASDNNLI